MHSPPDYNSRAAVAAVAMIVFDLIITFGHEVDFVWRRRFSTSSFLIIAIRWTLLFGALVLMAPPSSIKDCPTRIRLLVAQSLLNYVLTAVFSALRALALGRGSLPLFFVTLTLGLIPFVATTYLIASTTLTTGLVGQDDFACGDFHGVSEHTDLAFTLASRIPVILAEMIVVILTWMSTHKRYEADMQHVSRMSACLFENGNAYFVFLVSLNVLKCVVPAIPQYGQITVFLDALPPIFVYRFLMDIRGAALRNSSSASTLAGEFGTDLSTPVFVVPADADARRNVYVKCSLKYYQNRASKANYLAGALPL